MANIVARHFKNMVCLIYRQQNNIISLTELTTTRIFTISLLNIYHPLYFSTFLKCLSQHPHCADKDKRNRRLLIGVFARSRPRSFGPIDRSFEGTKCRAHMSTNRDVGGGRMDGNEEDSLPRRSFLSKLFPRRHQK